MPLLPGVPVGIRSWHSEKSQMKTSVRGTPPNHPESTGPENIGPERAHFGSIDAGAVGSLPATTLENNEKFRPNERAENGFAGGVGGATGTAVEQSLRRNALILLAGVIGCVSMTRG